MVLEAVKQNGLALGGALALLQADRELVLGMLAMYVKSASLLLLGVGLWHNNNLTCAQPTEVVQEIIIYFVNTIVVGRLMVLLCSHGLDFGLLTTFFPHSNQVSKVSFWA